MTFKEDKRRQAKRKKFNLGGSPGLVIIGDDSCSRGHGFESWHRILDGHFSCLKSLLTIWQDGPSLDK